MHGKMVLVSVANQFFLSFPFLLITLPFPRSCLATRIWGRHRVGSEGNVPRHWHGAVRWQFGRSYRAVVATRVLPLQTIPA